MIAAQPESVDVRVGEGGVTVATHTPFVEDQLVDQALATIEGRGRLSREQIAHWLASSNEHEAEALYEEHFVSGINDLEDRILAGVEGR